MSIEKIVLFHNYTDHDFVGTWNKVSEVIPAGGKRHMELWRAMHYGKHLVNDELNAAGLSQYCSPKHPDQVPEFIDRLKKCVIDDETIEVATSNATEELANLNKPEPKKTKKTIKPSVEEEFEGLKE